MFTGVWILRESASCSTFSPDLPKLPQHKRSNLGESLGWRQQSADRGLAEKTCEGREGGVFCLLKDILPTILQSANSIDSPGVDAGRPGRHPLELELPRQGVQLQMQQKAQCEKHQSTGIVAQVLLFFFRRILDV